MQISCREILRYLVHSVFFFSKDIPFFDRNILGIWTCAETESHTIIISYQVNIASTHYRTTSVRKGQATIGHPFSHQKWMHIQPHDPPLKNPNTNNIKLRSSWKYPNQTRGHQEETQCPSYRFRCLLLDLLWWASTSSHPHSLACTRTICTTAYMQQMSHVYHQYRIQ